VSRLRRPMAIALEENDAEPDPEEDVRVVSTSQVHVVWHAHQ
jgi:hypothetical protein